MTEIVEGGLGWREGERCRNRQREKNVFHTFINSVSSLLLFFSYFLFLIPSFFFILLFD